METVNHSREFCLRPIKCDRRSPSILINTPLQRGVRESGTYINCFNSFLALEWLCVIEDLKTLGFTTVYPVSKMLQQQLTRFQ